MPKATAQITIRDENDISIGVTAPPSPVKDQMWLDTSKSPSVMRRYTGSAWEVVTEMPKSVTPPSPATKDQIWLDTSSAPPVLKRYNGSTWEVVNDPSGQIDDAINNLQIGGRNLAVETDFKKYTSKWVCNNGAIINKSTGKAILAANGKDCYIVQTMPQRLEPNTTYTLSARFKDNGTTGGNGLRMYISINGAWKYKQIPSNADGVYSLTVTTPDSITNNSQITIDSYNTTSGSGTCEVWNIKLEKGNKATDWTPAPEDIDKSVQDAQDSANTANNILADISNDNKLTAVEKQSVKKEWDIIVGEKTRIENNATLYGITTEKTLYVNAYNELNTYLNPLLSNLTTTSTIVGSTFRNTFKKYYDARQDLVNAMAIKSKQLADNAQSSIDNLQIGGNNIATHTNQGITGWRWLMQTGGIGITEVIENGIRCCKLTRDSVVQTGWSYMSYGYIGREKYMPDRKYTISLEVKASVDTALFLQLQEGNSSNKMTDTVKTNNTIANTWTKVSATLTTISKLPSSIFQVLYINGMNTGVGVSYIFRNLKIEEGTKATAWTPAPEDIQADIDNIQVGGRNLLMNSLLKGITFPYTSAEYNWRTASVNPSSTVLRTRELIKDCPAFPQGVYGIKFVNSTTTDLNVDIAQDGRVMEHGETYTISAYFKLTKGTPNFALQYGTTPFFGKAFESSQTWIKHSFTFVYDKTKFSNNLQTNIYFGIRGNSFEGYACGFKLEKGNKATDWSPAHEDIDTAIDSKPDKTTVYTKTDTDAKIKATADAITSRVTSLEETEVQVRQVTSFRYIRDWLSGNTFNSGNHWVELQVFANGVNIAKGLIPTSSNTPTPSNIRVYTDGDTTAGNYVSQGSSDKWYYLQVDLGSDRKDVDMIKVWHYYTDGRSYRHKLEVSRDGVVWYRLYNSDLNGMYKETVDGRVYILNETYGEKRLSTAEQKITSEAIIATVKTTVDNAKSDAINSANASTDGKLKNYDTIKDVESKITQSAKDVTFAFSQSSIANLIRNGNNLQGLKYWGNGNDGNVGTSTFRGVWDDSNVYIPSGKRAIVLRSTNCIGEFRVDQGMLKVVKNKTYTLTFYVAAHRCSMVGARITNSGWSALANVTYSNLQSSGFYGGKSLSDWKLCKITFDTGENESIRVGLFIDKSENDGYAWFMDMMLCEGEESRPWSPHPEELVNGSTIIDGDGITINNGAIKIKNKDNATVLSSDSKGNLTIAGTFLNKNWNNVDAIKIENSTMYFYDWERNGRELGLLYSSYNSAYPNVRGFSLSHAKLGYMNIGYESSTNTYTPYITFDKYMINPTYAAPIRVWESAVFHSAVNMQDRVYIPQQLIFDKQYSATSPKIFKNASDSRNILSVQVSVNSKDDGFMIQSNTGSILFGVQAGYNYPVYSNNNMQVNGNFTVTGSKNSLQATKSYGERLINAIESAEYYYSDFGFGEINNDGECYISIDDILQECVNLDCEYHIFTQKYNGDITSIDRHRDYFIVHGEPKTKFSWQYIAKRLGYENVRLDVPEMGTIEDIPVFTEEDLEVKTAEEILNNELDFRLEDILMEG